ncbi:TATA element modulatory factor isoform X1 [Alosa sapidissima]|uniref:TATA element modulatory factor isoform X1 n=1 Tax=Alosa sapidissima TaxID=34773 RepID=UPI001C0A0850|nr:TATA element modulatory factor isoform X1 [Alosa sapidissima]
MSWFNASQLSSFAKQALTTAQKSIDRVLDIKEDDPWGDTVVATYDDLPGKPVSAGGWGMNQWDTPVEECTKSTPPSSEAITTPVTRTVVDETETFFSAFLSPGDLQTVKSSQVVSVPPIKSSRGGPQEKTEKKDTDEVDSPQQGEATEDRQESEEDADVDVDVDLDNESIHAEPRNSSAGLDVVLLELEPAVSVELTVPEQTPASENQNALDNIEVAAGEAAPDKPQSSSESELPLDHLESPEAPEPKSPSKASLVPPKEILLESKDAKGEDRQSDTPSPPVSAFSSGTSTTSDIEVLDHESVLSESSASSRQETAEAKAGLHLMQGSFQLLSASACADYPRLGEDYPKLTESCGSSSDAFERIDSFSVQSLDSRSVSEVNSDDELPGGRTLASVTSPSSHTPPASLLVPAQNKEEGEEGEEGEERRHDETMTEQSLDEMEMESEMEESGRSATPVNCEQPEEEPESDVTLSGLSMDASEPRTPPITEEMRGASTSQILELQKIIDDLTSRLETRETQLLSVSKDKARLEEECDNLKDEIIGLREETTTVQSLQDEFTHRIAEAERKAQLACKERDIAKKEIKGLREELASRFNSNETLELIRDKEEQIRGLLEEGEKLSKQQLQHSNIIKKLRVKEKESDLKITKQTKQLKEQEEELKHLQQVLDGKEEVEKQHRDNIKKLNAVVERQERESTKVQSELEEFLEKNRSLQAALDNSYKELAELHKANASKDSVAQELALSQQEQAREELERALERATEEARMQQEALANQVADLRLALQRAEQQQARKEDYLREEISELQQRLQAAETRNQELSHSVTSATRPLLRQIENLQASLGGQTESWEKLEKSISDRLVDAEAQLAVAVEKERAATDELHGLKAQVASLESQSSLLRQEKGRLQGLLEAEKSRRERLEDDISREHVELTNLRGEHSRALEEAKKEKLLMTNQLEMEKMKVEQEKKKCYLAQEALKEKERKAMVMSVSEPPASSPSLSRSSSISGPDHAGLHSSFLAQQEDSLDHSFGTMSISGSNLYEVARLGGGSSIMENLQSQLKLREGEIAQLQLEIASLERSRAVMAEELVRLTNQNDELEEKVKEIPRLRINLKDLEQRHNTILQMYGEKAEEAEELRLDLEDVKNMYKTQIDELLKNQK